MIKSKRSSFTAVSSSENFKVDVAAECKAITLQIHCYRCNGVALTK